MEARFTPIEEIRSTLDRLRQDPKTQRNFPQGIMDLDYSADKNLSC